MKARENIINAIATSASKLNNDDLCLLLIYVFALIDHAAGTAEDKPQLVAMAQKTETENEGAAVTL